MRQLAARSQKTSLRSVSAGGAGNTQATADPMLHANDMEWAHILLALPKPRGSGRKNRRVFLDAVVHVATQHIAWTQLPKRYGRGHSVYVRFMRWARQGLWNDIIARLPDKSQAAAVRRLVMFNLERFDHRHVVEPNQQGLRQLGRPMAQHYNSDGDPATKLGPRSGRKHDPEESALIEATRVLDADGVISFMTRGLAGIRLRNGFTIVEEGMRLIARVQRPLELDRAIVIMLVNSNKPLSAASFRFLRKVASINRAELASMLGVTQRQVLFWEYSEDRIPAPVELIVRSLAKEHFSGFAEIALVSNTMRRLQSGPPDALELEFLGDRWRQALY